MSSYFPPCVSAASTKGVSRAPPLGCGVRTGGSLVPAALKTNTPHLWWADVWEVVGLTGPRRRRRKTRRTCGWTSASPTPQASPQTWTAGTSLLSLVGHLQAFEHHNILSSHQKPKLILNYIHTIKREYHKENHI